MWNSFALVACVSAGGDERGLGSFLGVGIQETPAGVEVTRIAPDSPAEKPASRQAM